MKINLPLAVQLLLLLSTTSVLATEVQRNPSKKNDTVKYSDLKKPKAVKTGDKVYTWIDESGNRIYSDTPKDGAELMEIEEGTNYSPVNRNTSKNYSSMKPKVVSSNQSYSNFSIVSPANGSTIRNNSGNFQVALDIRPRLRQGHKIKLTIDGNPVESANSSITTLRNIDRGTHTLIATIVDAKGKVLKTSATTTLHLHRAH